MTGSRVLMVALSSWSLTACVEQAPDVPTEEDLKAARANILSQAPTPKLAVNANLEGRVSVLGCDVDTDVVEPGKAFTITTYWKVNQAVTDGWRMFFHVNGASKSQFINHDHTPLQGKYPVTQWKPGEILRDIYKISLPGNWQGNEVNIYTGLWKGPLRMKVTTGPQDGDNRVLLAKLPVRSTGAGAAPVSSGPVPGRKRYLARKVKIPPKIDGKLDDAAWKDAPETEPFVATMTGLPVEQKTTAKLVYDDKNLYIAFQNADTDVWSDLTKHDDKLWTQEVDEVMIDGDGDGKTYIELQVNPNGTTFDSYLPTYRQNQNDWESGMKVGVKVDGTLNKRDDVDKGWTVEIALPLEAVKGRAEKGPQIPPKVGDMWRINLYRMDLPRGKPQVGSGWSPPMLGDFHALDKFGELVFADEKGAIGPAGAPAAGAAKANPKGLPLTGRRAPSPITPMTAQPAAQPAAKSQGRK
ncbi:MAG TPA: carbohydrate-binding family 9-like protein [Polyangia bacterium]|nr:carbohydrate-binding family 9-like protein [Polyangia bacterium]